MKRPAASLAVVVVIAGVVATVGCGGGAGEGEGEGDGPGCVLESNSCELNTLRFCNVAGVVEERDCGADGGFCDAVTLACQGLDAGAACDDRAAFCADGLACSGGVCTDTGGVCVVPDGDVSVVCPGVCENDCDGAVARHCADGATTVAVDCDAFAQNDGASCLDAAGASRCLIPFEGTCARGTIETADFVLERCNGSDIVCVIGVDGGACDLADVAADIGADGCAGDVLYAGEGVDRVAVDCGAFGYSCSGGQCVGRAIGESCTALFNCGADALCIDGTCIELIGSCDVPEGEFIAVCEDVACNLPPIGTCDGALNHFCIDGVEVDTSDCVAYADDAAATCAVDDVLGVTGCQVPDGAICLRAVAGLGDYFEVCASDAGVGCVEDEDGIGHCLPAADCEPNAQPPQTCDGTILHAGCLFSGHAYDIDCAALGAVCEERGDGNGRCLGADEGRHCNEDIECDGGLACVDTRCAAIDDVCPFAADDEFAVCAGVGCGAGGDVCAGDDVLSCSQGGELLIINCDASGPSTCGTIGGFAPSCTAELGGVCTKFVDGRTYFGVCAGAAATTSCVEDAQGFGRCTSDPPVAADDQGDFCNGDTVAVTLLSGHVFNIDCAARGGSCAPGGVCVGVDAGFGCGDVAACDAGLACVDGLCAAP